ncbi:hypothetical protein OOK28_28040 [Streptomyces sp. NBC_00687]|nr:hypothetical protein [Streptomyces sp. NBC_00687]
MGAGSGPWERRAARAASSVVRPLPGGHDEPEDGGGARLEGGELPDDVGAFDGFGCRSHRPGRARWTRSVRADRGRGELQGAGEVQIGSVRGHRHRVAGEQVGERAGDAAQGDGEAGCPVDGGVPRAGGVLGPREQGGAEDRDHGAGGGVDDRSSGRSAAQPEGVRARGADRQLQYAVQEMTAVGGGVRHGGRLQHPCLAPGARRDPDVGAGRDVVPHGDGKRVEAETFGADERQTGVGQRDHGVGRHHTAAVTGVQHEPDQAVDGFVAGDDRSVVVGGEPRAAGASRQVADAHQGVVPRRADGVRQLQVPGPRASSRHARSSPPRSSFRR